MQCRITRLPRTNLGVLYYLGKGAPKDPVLAYMWLSLSADSGFEPAKKYIQKLNEQMSPVQIAEAKLKASKFLAAETKAAPSADTPNANGRP